jgi:citrate synthase
MPAQSIAYATTDKIVVRGKDLVDELIGRIDFTSMICFHLRGEMPTPAQRAVVDSVLVALMEHGLTPSSLTARLIYSSAPEAVQGAVAAGLLGAGGHFLGSTQDAGKLLREGAIAIERGTPVEDFATAAVARHLEARLPFPGFGHHIHRPDDPRAPRLVQVAREHAVAGVHVEVLEAIGVAMDKAKGRHVTVNATGAVAAVLLDAGFPWNSLRGFSLIARAAGLVGHVLEEAERPIDRAIWDAAEAQIPYDGPGAEF